MSTINVHHTKTYVGDGDARGGLPASDASKASLVLDDAVWNSHLAAKCGQEKNQLKIKYCLNLDF